MRGRADSPALSEKITRWQLIASMITLTDRQEFGSLAGSRLPDLPQKSHLHVAPGSASSPGLPDSAVSETLQPSLYPCVRGYPGRNAPMAGSRLLRSQPAIAGPRETTVARVDFTLRGLRSAVLTLSALLLTAVQLSAQTVCLPLPRLLTCMPMGGQVGTTVEIVITGENLDEGGQLVFSSPAIQAERILRADGTLDPLCYRLSISADCPPGLHEMRLLTRLGISSSRIFVVDRTSEVAQTAGNTSLTKAMPLTPDTICNSVVTARSIDYYTFQATAGDRLLIHCDARGIESKLQPVLTIANAAGADLRVERHGSPVDFQVPQDGEYRIRVHDLTYQGGAGYFYRLSLRSLAAETPLPAFPSITDVRGFSWPPADLPEQAAASETEPNAPDQPQQIALPCDIAGAFATAADVDTFEFTAEKGEIWWVEVASERLGRPTDPAVLVQQVTEENGTIRLTDLTEFSDIASPIKPSSNGYSYDGPPYNGGSADLIGKLEIPATGRYRLQLSDLFGGTRSDPRNIYRLVIRRAAPDFALCAWGLHMELRNGDRNAISKPLALRGGVTIALEVAVVRRDGFDGAIELQAGNLPEGVTASGINIPAGQNRGILLLTADQNAPRGMSLATITGVSEIDGKTVERHCFTASMSWPVRNAWQEIPSPRLLADLPISVCGSEFAPLSIRSADQSAYEVVQGESLTIPLVLTKRTEFSGSVLQARTFGNGFTGNPVFDISLAGETAAAVLNTKTLKTAPGEYRIAFYGSAVSRYRYNAAAVDSIQKQLHDAEQELQQLQAAAVPPPAEQQNPETEPATPNAEQANDDSAAQTQQLQQQIEQLRKQLEQAEKTAAATDTVDIMISEPVTIRVTAAETP